MKSLFNFRAGIIFFFTAGLPIVMLVVLVAVGIAGSQLGNDPTVDLGGTSILFAWILGFVLLQLWGMSAGVLLSSGSSVPPWIRWSTQLTGIISLLILIFVFREMAIGFLSVTEASESDSIAGLGSIASTHDRLLQILIVIGVWFVPRWLFFGLLAKLLVLRETSSRWLATFFFFVCWPVGVWFLQPRIRKVLQGPRQLEAAEHLI